MKMLKNVLLILTIGVFVAGCTKSPESALDEFLEHIDQGNVAAAQQMVSARHRSDPMAESRLQRALTGFSQQLAKDGGIETIDKHTVQKSDAYAKLRVHMKTKSGQSSTDMYELYREDGKWKVSLN